MKTLEEEANEWFEQFNKQANENLKNRGTVDFSKEVKNCNNIIKKSKIPFPLHETLKEEKQNASED